MKKNRLFVYLARAGWKKCVQIMKLTTFLILLFVVDASASFSQNTKISVKVENGTLSEIFSKIEEQSEYRFFYQNEQIRDVSKKTVDVTNENILELVSELLKETGLSYKLADRNIIIFPTSEENPLDKVLPQQKSISGKVIDSSGVPLPGVTVVLKGTTNGTITDADGKYSVTNVPGDAILAFSFVGMKTQEIKVAGKTAINVTMEEETTAIDEVVAIGYGTQKKKLTTGASNHVENESIQKLNSTNPMKAMQSLTSGINITKASGSPGSDYKIFIRGIGTIGNANPLYVVDGVTVSSIKDISPSDIESIDVLKDAASSAIYGSRGANGVVLITTKQGKAGKPIITYDAYYGVQNLAHKIDMLNAQDYLTIATEQGRNSSNFPTQVYNYDAIKSGKWFGTNWLNEFENKNAPIQNHNIGVTGGTEQSVYSIGASYLNQEGFLGNPTHPNYMQYTFRVNSEHKLIKNNNKSFDILKIGENINFSKVDQRKIDESAGLQSIIKAPPFMPAFNDDGSFYIDNNNPWSSSLGNPIALINYQSGENKTITTSFLANAYIAFQPIKKLIVRSSFGYNYGGSSVRAYYPMYNLDALHIKTLSTINQQMSNTSRWILDNTLTYDFSIKEKHNFKLLAGMSAENSGIGESISGTNFSPQLEGLDYAYLSNSLTVDATNGTKISGNPIGQNKIASYFGRASYDFNQTYMATVILRADGSSNFASGHRWGYFPSISGGWIVTNEPFMKTTSQWLENFKLRASWGQNGNQAITPFQYLSAISNDSKLSNAFIGSDKTKFSTGYYSSILANPNISWEVSKQTDLGFDMNLLSNRLSITFDWYSKLTSKWLVQAPIPDIYGTGAPYVNGGDIKNQGMEFSIGWHNRNNNSFHYSANANVSINKNKITRIANSEGIIHGSNNALGITMTECYRAQVGYPVGYFWGLTNLGIFQTQDEINNYKNSEGVVIQPQAVPGDYIRKDWNDDGVINDKDKTMIGDPNPNVIFSFSYNMDYKGFDFSININGVLGNQIAWAYFNGADDLSNSMSTKMDRWHGAGTSNTQPRAAINSANETIFSDRYISNGDYLRLSNLTLGYDFKRLWKVSPLQQIRFYITAQNLYTVTGYKGLDPEVGGSGLSFTGISNWAGGIDLASYPSPRTFMVGLSIKY